MKIIHYILIATLVLIAFLVLKKISVNFFRSKSAYAQESKTEVSEINRANFPYRAIDRASALYDL